MAITFVCSCQFILAIDNASNLAIMEMDDAFKGEKEAFLAFWAHKDITEPMGPVAGHLGTGAGYNASAMIEPRMWKTAWKGGLYSETVAQLTQIRLDILMLGFALAGSDGKPDGIFEKFEKATEWKACQDDLNHTLIDAQTVIIGLLSDDKGGFDPVSKLKTV